jgi:hypothetical protein
MRRAFVLLIVVGGIAALFATASRTPPKRTSRITYYESVAGLHDPCKKPAPIAAEACLELQREAKAARAQLGQELKALQAQGSP